ncbi:uncharacterized protein LOC141588672 [Silene latifolia]|uniref:uncharacterized protein LOC141588672 n=1 Tax=Silene latifolia TaxID=37657 RepID=UPI003D780A59
MAAVSMRDKLAPKKVVNPSIVKPPIQANNFDVKATLLQLVQGNQFRGGATENPNEHLNEFLDSCDMFRANGVSEDVIRLRLFPYSLRGSAKEWLKSCEPDSFRTWDDVSKAFLNKYFPPQRTAKIKSELQGFTQHDDETLYKAWERYKGLQRLCPHHGIGDDELINNFYEGLSNEMKMNLDFGSGNGALDKIDHKKAKELIEEMASQTFHWNNDRHERKGKSNVESTNNVEVKGLIEELKQQIVLLNSSNTSRNSSSSRSQVYCCEICGDQGHSPNECPLIMGEANYMEQVVEEKGVEDDLVEIVVETPKVVDEPTKIVEELKQPLVRTYVPPIPFPKRLARAKFEQKYGKFMHMMKGVNITMPFVDVIKEIPAYGKFLKELISNKNSLSPSTTVNLSKECSVILMNELPQKLENPESFSIPCTVGAVQIERALCDLRASISLMPLKIFKKLKDYKLFPTRVSLQLSDRSVRVDVLEDCLNEQNLEPSYLDLLEVCPTNKDGNRGDPFLRVDVKGDLGKDDSKEDEFHDQINDEIESFLNSPDSFNLSSLEDAPWLDNSSSDWGAQVDALEVAFNGGGMEYAKSCEEDKLGPPIWDTYEDSLQNDKCGEGSYGGLDAPIWDIYDNEEDSPLPPPS